MHRRTIAITLATGALTGQALGVAHPTLAAADVTFLATGVEQMWVVPTGVSAIHVVLIGGHGGTANSQFVFVDPAPGGFGAQVSGDLTVNSGDTLYIEVGGAGGMAAGSGTSRGGAGGFNGGAIGGPAGVSEGAGGGGGASDIRTLPSTNGATLGSRLIVAAGGGGGGATEAGSGAGGDAGASGGDAASGDTGGGAGTGLAGGAGGTGNYPGQDGALGMGGAGAGPVGGAGGGGGGGGYYGGGGGADAAGGGGGSSYLGSASNGSVGVAAVSTASISITYLVAGGSPPPSPSPTSGPDNGTVDVQFSVTSNGACIELSTGLVDFGSVALGAEDVAATPDITVTNCGSVTEDVLAHGSDASGTVATWTLVDDGSTCADTLGTDQYRLSLQDATTTVGLSTAGKTLETLAAAATGTHTARMYAACPGSTGAGELMTTQIVFVATTGG